MEFLSEFVRNHLHKFSGRISEALDRIFTYCAGGGLAWWSCAAKTAEPILSVFGILIGIGTCLWRVWRDIKKDRADSAGKK